MWKVVKDIELIKLTVGTGGFEMKPIKIIFFIFVIITITFVFSTACKQKPITESKPTISVPAVEPKITTEKVTDRVYQENTNIEKIASINPGNDRVVPTSPKLESWIGDYTFSEFAPPNQNMFYRISIYKENGNYFAKITIDGFQTIERLQAKVSGDDNSIKIFFSKYLPNNRFESYVEGDILTLQRNFILSSKLL